MLNYSPVYFNLCEILDAYIPAVPVLRHTEYITFVTKPTGRINSL